MQILDKIVKHKREEVDQRKKLFPEALLRESIHFEASPLSLKQYILRPDLTGVIAEYKRASPSRGVINAFASVEETTIGYMQSKASALSVLTDEHFFQGKLDDLKVARKFNYCPILRKDFIIDPYQILEAKSGGADAILLLASCLTKEEIALFSKEAHELGMEVLLEVHNEEEIAKYHDGIDVIGVNNRDLKNFDVSISHSKNLIPKLPTDVVKISESGLSTVTDLLELYDVGYDGFLIGSYFMQHENPARVSRLLLEDYLQKRQQR